MATSHGRAGRRCRQPWIESVLGADAVREGPAFHDRGARLGLELELDTISHQSGSLILHQRDLRAR
jgi:hypothetical protein